MAVGFPAKTNFATGDVLTATQMNDVTGTLNLLNPSAKGTIFAASAANTPLAVAVGTNNQVLVADSAATAGVKWSTLSSASGLNYITGTSFSAVSAVSLPANTFSSTYRNYAILINITSTTSSGATALCFRMRASGTDNTSANYSWARQYFYSTANGSTGNGSDTAFVMMEASIVGRGDAVINLFAPQLTERTLFTSAGFLDQSSTTVIGGNASGTTTVTTSYDAITFYPSTATITGRYEVYGYANS